MLTPLDKLLIETAKRRGILRYGQRDGFVLELPTGTFSEQTAAGLLKRLAWAPSKPVTAATFFKIIDELTGRTRA